MADNLKSEKPKKQRKVSKKKNGKKFIVKTSKNIGVNPDGSYKEVYKRNEEIELFDKHKIETLKSLNII